MTPPVLERFLRPYHHNMVIELDVALKPCACESLGVPCWACEEMPKYEFYLRQLLRYAPALMELFDDVSLIGNPMRKAAAGRVVRWLMRVADFRKLEKPYGAVEPLVILQRRAFGILRSAQ